MKKTIPQEYHSHLKERNAAQEGGHRQSAVTTRGVLVGCAMCVIIAIGVPYGGMVIRGTRLGLSSATPAALAVLGGGIGYGDQPVKRSWFYRILSYTQRG